MSKFVFFFQPMVADMFFRENGDLLFLPVSGNKLQIRAWEMLPAVAQQLLVNLHSSTFIDDASMGVNRRVMTTAEAFLLIHICGPTAAADMIAQVDAGGQYSGDLSRYVRSQFLRCKDIGDLFSKYTPDSLDAYLTSPFFGERPKPVKNPRPSEGKIKRCSIDTAESSYDGLVPGDQLLAMDLDLVLNHTSASEPLLPDALFRLNCHEHQLKRARKLLEDPSTPKSKESVDIICDCPFEVDAFVQTCVHQSCRRRSMHSSP